MSIPSLAPRAQVDRAAVITTSILQLLFHAPTSPDLRQQIEAMLRDEIHDIRRELIGEIRSRLYGDDA
jgi:hypothetical protein